MKIDKNQKIVAYTVYVSKPPYCISFLGPPMHNLVCIIVQL